MTRRGALMRGDRRRGFHRCDAVLHRVLHLLERAHLDLAHALARDAEFFGELLERDRILGEPARLEDAPLAVVEHAQRLAERLAAVSSRSAFCPGTCPGCPPAYQRQLRSAL